MYGQLRKYLVLVYKKPTRRRESEVLEGDMKPDRVHKLLVMPSKYMEAQVVGYIKGKSAIHKVGGCREEKTRAQPKRQSVQQNF
jgi:putative transposase